jgi:hypothetical protein
VTEFLVDKQKEIADRLNELHPLIAEYERLLAAEIALAGLSASSNAASDATTVTRRGLGRPRGPKTAPGSKAASIVAATPAEKRTPTATTSASTRRRKGAGRRKGSGKRGAEALTHIEQRPGITIAEMASKMGIKQNYLYRVLPPLEQDRKVQKKGRGWHPVKTSSAAT